MDSPTPCQDSHPLPSSFSASWASRQGAGGELPLGALGIVVGKLLSPLPRLFPEKSVKNAQVSGGLPHQIQDKLLDFKARGVKHGGKAGGLDFVLGVCF